MKNKYEDGVLVVEASLALFFFTFFLLFIWSFSGIFAAQNAVSHAAFQSVQSIAVDNMNKEVLLGDEGDRSEVLGMVNEVISWFSDGTTSMGVKFRDVHNKEGAIKKQFLYFLGGQNGEENAKALGIDVDNMVFEVNEEALANGNISITIHYTVYFEFSFFGVDRIDLIKHAECRLFGYSG